MASAHRGVDRRLAVCEPLERSGSGNAQALQTAARNVCASGPFEAAHVALSSAANQVAGGHRGTQRTRRTRAPGAKAEEPLVAARLRHDLTRDWLCAVGAAGLGADDHDRYERARRR